MGNTSEGLARVAIIVIGLGLASAGGLAQEDELPTLKLDRIPAQPAFAGQTRAAAAPATDYGIEVVATGLSAPWALAFLPGGDMLVTEYTGSLRIVGADGRVGEPIEGLPEISNEGWAGLFDVALAPDFASTGWVYFSYTAPSGDADAPNVPRVARGRLDRAAGKLGDVEVVVDGFGGQELHFGADGKLYVAGAGDVWNDDAQDPGITFGKLLRLNPDGSIPADNPWATAEGVRREIYSYGHRDISGIATHPLTGDIWITEHGPRGGDELNRIRPGGNYGWKIASYGTDYDGTTIGNGDGAADGTIQPRYFWRPSIAPSGLVFYTGRMFPEWRGSVFVTALSGEHISRLVLRGGHVVAEERLLTERGQRIRELKVGPDGALYALTNEASDAPRGTAELLRIHAVAE